VDREEGRVTARAGAPRPRLEAKKLTSAVTTAVNLRLSRDAAANSRTGVASHALEHPCLAELEATTAAYG
jgi:hypothetical protein